MFHYNSHKLAQEDRSSVCTAYSYPMYHCIKIQWYIETCYLLSRAFTTSKLIYAYLFSLWWSSSQFQCMAIANVAVWFLLQSILNSLLTHTVVNIMEYCVYANVCNNSVSCNPGRGRWTTEDERGWTNGSRDNAGEPATERCVMVIRPYLCTAIGLDLQSGLWHHQHLLGMIEGIEGESIKGGRQLPGWWRRGEGKSCAVWFMGYFIIYAKIF